MLVYLGVIADFLARFFVDNPGRGRFIQIGEYPVEVLLYFFNAPFLVGDGVVGGEQVQRRVGVVNLLRKGLVGRLLAGSHSPCRDESYN